MNSPEAGWYADPDNPNGERYWQGASWADQRRERADATTSMAALPVGRPIQVPEQLPRVVGAGYEPSTAQPATHLNFTHSVTYKGGWPGLFGGENQTKALDRALRELNSRDHRVAAAVTDRWSVWKRLWMAFLALISLGFYVRVPNVILITEPIR